MPLSKVIVVGAGPSGLLLTLLLSRANIPVLLLEQTDILDTNPRASHYAEPSNYEFDRAGVLDAIRAEGFFPDGVSWRKLDENKTRLVMLRNPVPEDGQIDLEAERYRMVCLPLHKLGKILEDAVKREESAEEYRVVNFSPYRVHQRCVNRMRVGRVVLAADAAHLCNPFGGMGLTGGIADVGSLYDSLLGIHTGQADDSLLDKYDEVRRKIWHDIIDPISSSNMRRLIDLDADTALDGDPFLQVLKRAETDKELQAQMRNGMMSLRHDMSQYYQKV